MKDVWVLEMNSIARRLRLKENHPTAIKLNQLFELADKLGISLEFSNSTRVLVSDSDRDENLPPLWLEDIEDSDYGGNFPPTTEYKLVYNNPAYLSLQEKKEREELEERQEANRLKIEQAKAEEQARLAKIKEDKERQERELLRTLLSKYPDYSKT